MPKPFRFGVVGGNAQSRETWTSFARHVEELGYSSLLLPDRTQMNVAPFAALAVAATATTTLRVGSYVFCNDYRHPAVLAKEAATLALLSDGRFELGIGAGVGPEDYNQLGLPFDSAGTRVGRVEEAVTIIKQFFTEERVNFKGKYYTVTDLPAVPKPVQRPPILIGSANQRMLSIAGCHADIVSPTPKFGRPGEKVNDVPLAQKIEWIREAAGARFEQLELSQTDFGLVITDSPAEAFSITGGPYMQKRPMSTEQAVEHLLAQREQLGYSYIQVNAGQMENFAPVVARLAGK
ncbi:LLM class F420-dependent oxidoreductase [Dictyobacter sp. S3.2.2.5]|uniref:LLM class F420-dependent oxidoreductase n=1 Tax=Dictyobacter halimunensis TaxID=3026934 RepID=A0ABQ6FLA6_9CHLR|nr:LLM class F420-dependent oxidoreductase [Dictyobacter sp. S3.2.2.5]